MSNSQIMSMWMEKWCSFLRQGDVADSFGSRSVWQTDSPVDFISIDVKLSNHVSVDGQMVQFFEAG